MINTAVNTDVLIINLVCPGSNCRKCVNVVFILSFVVSLMSDISEIYFLFSFWSFTTWLWIDLGLFFFVCLGALQTFPVSVHIGRFEVRRYCFPPPHVRCVTARNPSLQVAGCYSRKQSAQQEISDWSSSSWGILADWNDELPPFSSAGCLLECQEYHRTAARVVSDTECLRLQRWWWFLTNCWGFPAHVFSFTRAPQERLHMLTADLECLGSS